MMMVIKCRSAYLPEIPCNTWLALNATVEVVEREARLTYTSFKTNTWRPLHESALVAWGKFLIARMLKSLNDLSIQPLQYPHPLFSQLPHPHLERLVIEQSPSPCPSSYSRKNSSSSSPPSASSPTFRSNYLATESAAARAAFAPVEVADLH